MAAVIHLYLWILLILLNLERIRTLDNDDFDGDITERLQILEHILAEMENMVMETNSKVSEALDELDHSEEMLMRDFSRLQHTITKHARKSYKKSRKDAKKELSYDSNILKEMVQTMKNTNANNYDGDGSDQTVEGTMSLDSTSNKTQGTLNTENEHSEGIMTDSRVMFKATLLTEQKYHEGDTIIFPKIINNFGEGYDSEYGVFVTPRRGIYYFTVQLYLFRGSGAEIGIFVGDECISWAEMSPRYDSCNNLAAITRLNVGDAVFVKQVSTPWGETFKSPKSDLWNTFSGVLIR